MATGATQNIPQKVTHELDHVFLSTCTPVVFACTALKWHQDSTSV